MIRYPVDKIIPQYQKNLSILNIRNNLCCSISFSFSKICQENMENLKNKKAIVAENIPAKVIKDASTVIVPH